MPFKSEAQREKFKEMVKNGKMSQSTFDEWEKDSPKNLPERVTVPSKSIKKVKKI